jgi:hypothetical protein
LYSRKEEYHAWATKGKGKVEVSGQLHAPAALFPQKKPLVAIA